MDTNGHVGAHLLERARTLDGRIPSQRLPRQLGVANRIQQGDSSAYADLCDALLDRLYGYVYLRVGEHQAAEMVVQTACLTGWQQRAEILAGGINNSIWLMQILRTLVANTYGERYEVADVTAKTEEEQALIAMIRSLQPEQQEWAILRFWLKFRARDAAAIVGMPHDDAVLMQAETIAELHRMAA